MELYDAICAYVFEEKDATLNSKKAESCFILIKHLLDEEWKRSDIASKGWSTRKSAHPHVINEMKVSSSMSSKSDDNEPIVSTDSQMNVKTLPESAVKKKPDIFSDFAHGDKALLESLREFAQMRTRIKKPMTDRAKQMLCNKLEKFDRHDWKAIAKIPSITKKLDSKTLDDFAEVCKKVASAISPLASKLDKVGRSFSSLPSKIKSAVNSTTRFSSANQKASTSLSSLASQLEAIKKRAAQLVSLKAIVDWTGVGKQLTDKLSDALQNVEIEKLARVFFNFITDSINAVSDFLAGTDSYQLGQDLVDFAIRAVTSVDWAGLAQAIGRFFGEAFIEALDFMGGLVSRIADYFEKKVAEGPFNNVGLNIVYGIYYGIQDAITNVASWIVENVFNPFIISSAYASGSL